MSLIGSAGDVGRVMKVGRARARGPRDSGEGIRQSCHPPQAFTTEVTIHPLSDKCYFYREHKNTILKFPVHKCIRPQNTVLKHCYVCMRA
jgi:hypothetical protein